MNLNNNNELIKEDPDDLFGDGGYCRTFGFQGNFGMLFMDSSEATHWNLFCVAKRKLFNEPYEKFITSVTTQEMLKQYEKSFRSFGVPSENLKKYLSNKATYFRRSTFFNDVDEGFLGRISFKRNMVSFWNPADSFRPQDKAIAKKIIESYNFSPEKITFNFYNGVDKPDTNLSYKDFFKDAMPVNPLSKPADSSHIIHNLSPEKKKQALLAQGAKPKAAMGVQQRYAMGESSFKKFISPVLTESPDRTIKGINDGLPGGWVNPDARTFVIADDFICISKENNTWHTNMYEDLEKIFKYNKKEYRNNYIMHGQPSVTFLSQMGNAVERSTLLKKYPNWIQGRIWLDKHYIAFWNHEINVRNNLNKIVMVINMVGDDPENFQWEIENKKVVSFNDLKNTKNIDGELPKVKDDNWQQTVHTLPPEKKGEVLKAMGVKPKAPLGAQQRYAMGESFKEFFNESAEYVEGTVNGKSVNASYSNGDARAFIIEKDFNIIANNEDNYHWELIAAIFNEQKRAKYKTHGIPSEEFLSKLPEITSTSNSRGNLLVKCPYVIQGRLWLDKKCIGFWNKIGQLKENFSYIVKLFNDNNINPDEFIWEIPGYDNLVTFEDFKKELNIAPSPTEKSNEVEDWQKKIHLAPAQIKGDLLKAKGIKPKPSMGVQQRYLNGESLNFKDFFNVIQEKTYRYSIPKDKELLLYDFYMLTHLTALEKEGKFEPGDKVDPYGQGITTDTHSMGLRDNTKHSFEHIKKEVIDHLQPALLEAAFYSVSCEFRHLFDRNHPSDVARVLGKEAGIFCNFFQYNLIKLTNNKNPASDDPVVQKHIKDRRHEFDTKHKIKMKENNSRNASYNASYKAVKKSLSDINKNKSSYESMTESDFINLAKKCFEKMKWNSSYGGEAWASICDAYIKLKYAKSETDKIIFIDNMYHQQHNTDTVFNKIASYCKNNSYSWILNALNFKADVRDNWDRIKKIKETTEKNGVSYLRDVDKMYIEMLKASGDRSYEQYYQIQKPDGKPSIPYNKEATIQKALDLAVEPLEYHSNSKIRQNLIKKLVPAIYVGDGEYYKTLGFDKSVALEFDFDKLIWKPLEDETSPNLPVFVSATNWINKFGEFNYKLVLDEYEKAGKETKGSLPEPDLSGITNDDVSSKSDATMLTPVESKHIIAFAITRASRPLIMINLHPQLTKVAEDDSIKKMHIIYVGMIPDLIHDAQIPEDRLYYYVNQEWIAANEIPSSIKADSEKYIKGILDLDWIKLFGQEAMTKLKLKVQQENNPPNKKDITPSAQAIDTAVELATTIFRDEDNWRDFLKNEMLTSLAYIYVGTGYAIKELLDLPPDLIFKGYSNHNDADYAFGDWLYNQTYVKSLDANVYYIMNKDQWISLFGQKNFEKVKKERDKYLENKKPRQSKSKDLKLSDKTINQAEMIASSMFEKPDFFSEILKNSFIENLQYIYMGTGYFIENVMALPSDYNLSGLTAHVDKTTATLSEWKEIHSSVGDLTKNGLYIIYYKDWIELFGKAAFDKLEKIYIKYIQNKSNQKPMYHKESFKQFFQAFIKESPDNIRNKNDPDSNIYYHNNDESYTILLFPDDNTPGSYVYRKDTPKHAGHSRLRSTLNRIRINDLSPDDNINDLHSDIPIDEIAKKLHERGAYEARIWTQSNIMSYWTEWRQNLIQPTLKVFKALNQNPKEYIFETDSFTYKPDEEYSPGCLTYEEFLEGKQDNSPEAIAAKKRRLEDRNLLAQAKLGMLKKDTTSSLSKPSFYSRSGD